MQKRNNSRLLFEASWEVCNKVGGIYTVLSTRADVMSEMFGENLVFFGPDIWKQNDSPYFIHEPEAIPGFEDVALPWGVEVRVGRWDLPSKPKAVLVKFDTVFEHLNDLYGKMWELYGVDSLNAYGDYPEACAFSAAVGITMEALVAHLGAKPHDLTAHFNEWTTGLGVLWMQQKMPQAATLFTTHATSIGRSICSNGKALYEYFHGYHGDQMAHELNMVCKHSLEKAAAHAADCFTAVSEVTARECEQLLDIRPQVVTPNGFDPNFVPNVRKYPSMRKKARTKLLETASALTGHEFGPDTFIVATSGRNEFRNKGIDLYISAMQSLEGMTENSDRDVLAYILVPAWVKEPSAELMENIKNGNRGNISPDWITHRLNNEDSDAIACTLRNRGDNGKERKVTIIFLPCYLDGRDGILNLPYYDALPGLDLTIFPSYYEPWGYTPLESVAFAVPTITTDKAGFGQWVLENFDNSFEASGVKVEYRGDSDFADASQRIAKDTIALMRKPEKEAKEIRKMAKATAAEADWRKFIAAYKEAYRVADSRRDERCGAV